MKTFVPSLLLAMAFLLPQQTFACTIPVFRYALERWELSTYDILVYHRGPLAADVQAALKKWSDAPAKANVEITLIDLAGKMTAEQNKLWQREGNKNATAWMLVRLQSAKVKEPSSWTGPCTAENVRGVLTSPVRQALVGHLSRGASIVYVLLSSDNAGADARGHALLRKQLPILEKRIKLPVQSEDGPKIKLPLPLKVSLPILTLDRHDPQEAELVRLLLATEEGLDKEKGPIVFPIFGRGRVLGALYDKELSEQYLYEATAFLCKDCSCQVKNENPGIDLLLAADWGHIFDQMFEKKDASSPPQKTVWGKMYDQLLKTEQAASKPIVATPAPQPPALVIATNATPTMTTVTIAEQAPASDERWWLWSATAGAGALVLASGAWFFGQSRKMN